MKTRIIILCMMVSCAWSASSQGTRLSLKQAIDTALKNNIATKQSALQVNTANINYQQAKYNLLPRAQGSYDYGQNNGRSIDPATNGYINQQLTSSSANAQGNIPLFSGFLLRNTIKQNELAFQTATMQWQQPKDELTLTV